MWLTQLSTDDAVFFWVFFTHFSINGGALLQKIPKQEANKWPKFQEQLKKTKKLSAEIKQKQINHNKHQYHSPKISTKNSKFKTKINTVKLKI